MTGHYNFYYVCYYVCMYVTTSQSERKLLQPLKEFGIYFEIISATLVLKVS